MNFQKMSVLKLTLALVLVTPLAALHASEPNKLQECVALPPAGGSSYRIGYSSTGWQLNETDDELSTRIDMLKKGLKGDATDADAWFTIALLYTRKEEKKQAATAYKEAARFYRELLAHRPNDGDLLTRLAIAECNDDKDCNGIKRLEQIVQQAPTSAYAWRTLAGQLRLEALCTIGLSKSNTTQNAILNVLALFIRTKPSKEQEAEFNRLMAASDASYLKAIQLAPNDAETYVDRGMNRWVIDAFRKVLQGQLTDTLQLETVMLNEQSIADLEMAAQVAPDDYRTVGLALVYLPIYALSQSQGDEAFAQKLLADPNSPLAINIERMKKILRTDMSADANGGATILYGMYGVMDSQCPDMESIVRMRLRQHPGDDLLESILAHIYASEKRFKELITLCQSRIERNDSPQKRVALAKAFALDEQSDKAIQEAEKALKADTNGIRSNMMLAALLLKYNATEESWKRAGTLLETASLSVTDETDVGDKARLYILQSIQSGLLGNRDQAERQLSKALRLNPENPNARKVVQALSQSSP